MDRKISSFGKLRKKFGNDVQHMRSTKTPGTPNFVIVHPTNDDAKISPEKQKQYCSGVVMLPKSLMELIW